MPDPLTPKRLRELRHLRSLSTAGEFAVHRYDCDDGDINYQLQGDGGEGDVLTNIFESVNANNRADAAYLAALLNSADALLDAAEERDRLKTERDTLLRSVTEMLERVQANEAGGADAERNRLRQQLMATDASAAESERQLDQMRAEYRALQKQHATAHSREFNRQEERHREDNLELQRLRVRVRELEARHRLYHTCIVCHCSLDEEQDQMPYCFDCHPTDDHMCDWDDAMRLAEAGDFVKAAALVDGEDTEASHD